MSCILQDHFYLFFDVISFQHVLHFYVGKSEIEWNTSILFFVVVKQDGQRLLGPALVRTPSPILSCSVIVMLPFLI